MKKTLALLLTWAIAALPVLAPVAHAQGNVVVSTTPLYTYYDLDSTTAISCSYSVEQPAAGKAVTSGSSTTTTSTDAAFANVAAGDIIWAQAVTTVLGRVSRVNTGRWVSAAASAASITVDTAWDLGTSPVSIRYQKQNCGASSGWVDVASGDSFHISFALAAVALGSGNVAFRIEARYHPVQSVTTAWNLWPGNDSGSAQCRSGTYEAISSIGHCTWTSATGSTISFSSARMTFPTQVRLVAFINGTDDADAAPEQIHGVLQVIRGN